RPGWLIAGCCAAAAAKYIEPPFWIFYPPHAEPFGAGWNQARLLSSLSAVILIIFLIAGGGLGDFFGRRRLLLIGLAGAVAANGLLLVTTSAPWHITLRALALISDALVLPLTLAPLNIFFRGKQRGIAFAWYILATTFASLLAGQQGQFFLNLLSWRWAYLVPMTMAAVAFVLIYRNLPENYVREPHHPDALVHAGWTLLVLAALYGVLQAGIVRDWLIPVFTVVIIAGAIGLGLVFWWEMRMPGNLLRNRSIRTRDMTMLIVLGALIQLVLMGFYLPTFRYFDVVKGYGLPTRVLALLPLLVGMLLAMRTMGRIWHAQRVRRVLTIGLLLTALSVLLMAIRPLTAPYLVQDIPLALFGFSILATKTIWTNIFFRTVA
ncbi:MAG: MFS transporter, partial [Caldilineaceae bacterium]|nr:MFS transporter [Caldilineaceae bacterium]